MNRPGPGMTAAQAWVLALTSAASLMVALDALVVSARHVAASPLPGRHGRGTDAPPQSAAVCSPIQKRNPTMTAAIALAVRVNAPPDRITDALSTAEGLASFWTADSHVEPQTGSVARLGFGGPELQLRVDRLTAGRRIEWTCLNDFPIPPDAGRARP